LLAMPVKDLGLRLLCLALAFFLWGVVFRAGEREIEVAVTVPVELVNLSPGLSVANLPRDTVEVRVRGPRRVVSRVPEMGLAMPVDLAKASEGQGSYRLRLAALRLPARAEAVGVAPSSLAIALEKVVTVRVPLRVAVQGEPQRGFAVAEVQADPPTAEVRGPRSEVLRVKGLNTTPISVEEASGSVTAEVSIIPPEDHVRLVEPALAVRATAVIKGKRGG
jgi:YbbR domain-containing protein